MSSSDALQKMIKLRSSDGEEFEVEMTVALESQTLKHMIEDNCFHSVIPLDNVKSEILAMVIEYCKRHVEVAADGGIIAAEDELKKFDDEFVNVDLDTLFDLVLAATYMDIESLHSLVSRSIGENFSCMSLAKIRQVCDITNDFTPEEEKKFSTENAWAFD